MKLENFDTKQKGLVFLFFLQKYQTFLLYQQENNTYALYGNHQSIGDMSHIIDFQMYSLSNHLIYLYKVRNSVPKNLYA